MILEAGDRPDAHTSVSRILRLPLRGTQWRSGEFLERPLRSVEKPRRGPGAFLGNVPHEIVKIALDAWLSDDSLCHVRSFPLTAGAVYLGAFSNRCPSSAPIH